MDLFERLKEKSKRIAEQKRLSDAIRGTGGTLSADQVALLSPEQQKALRNTAYDAGMRGTPSKTLAANYQMQQYNDAVGRLTTNPNTPPSQADLMTILGAKDYLTTQMSGGSYQGTGLNNQFLNDLEKGAKDPEFRKTTRYKTAYDQMTRSKTSTYLNEAGQTVTRTVPGLSTSIYPKPPSENSLETNDVVDERGTTEKIGISADRRKLVEKDIDIVDGVVNKLDSLEEVIVRLEPGVFTVGMELAEVDSAYNSVLLELKNYAELGVLAGPDMDLLESWIGNPTTIKQALKGGDEGTLLQLRQLRKAALEVKNKGLKELGQKVPVPEGARSEQTAYLNGRTIIPNADNSGWVYKDTGEPAQ